MKILHTADLHLGQIIYQNYDRADEHRHFFKQLAEWCRQEQPDALLISGDVFDIQQPSATVKKIFNDYFVQLHLQCPSMHIVITAGNHDSASRIQADSSLWSLNNVTVVGVPPAADATLTEEWYLNYIVKLHSGYIVALPYMVGERTRAIQTILDAVDADNHEGKPVVMMGHLAVNGLDPEGHDFDIGRLRTQEVGSLGSGYDYLALGHIHKPQTIGHPELHFLSQFTLPSPVVRYAGSVLHVSCDENYPHSVSMVEMDRHGGDITISQLRVDEWRHFHTLPLDGSSFTHADDALQAIKEFVQTATRGYIRLRMDIHAALPSNFSQIVYQLLEPYHEEWRYNPKMLWTGQDDSQQDEKQRPVFQVAELQQMTDPMTFIERTRDQYPSLDIEDVRMAFEEVKKEMERMREETQQSKRQKAKIGES